MIHYPWSTTSRSPWPLMLWTTPHPSKYYAPHRSRPHSKGSHVRMIVVGVTFLCPTSTYGASPAFFGWTCDWHRMHPSLVPLAIQCMFVLSPPWSSRIPRYVVTSTKLHFPSHDFPFLSFNFGFGLPSQTTPPPSHVPSVCRLRPIQY